jgi:hypothetical protein
MEEKSGWFLFVVSLGLLMATEIVLTVGIRITDFQPKFWHIPNLHETTDPMKPLFVSILQWCLLDPYGRIKVVSSCLLCCWGC